MNLPTLEERIADILNVAAIYIRPCRLCQTRLYFIRRQNSNVLIPYTSAGVNHFINCPHSGEFRGRHVDKRDSYPKSDAGGEKTAPAANS